MDVKRKKHREGTRGDLIKLINEETMLVNDPFFLKRLLINILIRNQPDKTIPRKESVPLLQTQSLIKREKKDVQTRDPLCIACSEDHLLDSVKIFMEKTLKERTKLLANKKQCYDQSMTSTHNAKTCKQRLLCRICQEYHPTEMHGYVKKVSEGNAESKDDTKHAGTCASVIGKNLTLK